jgi:hypothetical protein
MDLKPIPKDPCPGWGEKCLIRSVQQLLLRDPGYRGDGGSLGPDAAINRIDTDAPMATQIRVKPTGRRGSKRGLNCCVNGLRRNQESSSRPSCQRIGPDRRSRFGPALGSTSGQYMLRRGRMGGSARVSVLASFASSRSRRNSSMRARMAAKSSAARGRFTFSPHWVR